MRMDRYSFAAAISLVAVLLPSNRPLHAEATEAASGQALEEIVVTAERRAEDLQKAPVAVSVRTGSELQEQGRFEIARILEDIPSVSVSGAPVPASNGLDSPANQIAIRGVQSNGQVAGDAASVVPAVAEYVDGVVNGVGGSYDISRVEVLRGPQGTLYGRSATAGVVNIRTNDPTLHDFGGDGAIELGDYSLQHYTAAVNIPVADVFALRVAGNYYGRNGYDAPIGGRIETTDGRAKLLFKPSDDFSMLLGVAGQDNQERNGQIQGSISGTGSGDVTFSPVVNNGNVQTGKGYDETRQYWAEVNWNLGPATLTYLPALRTFTERTVGYTSHDPLFVTTALQIPHDYFHTQELRLTSDTTTPLQWQGGLFYYHNQLIFNATSTLIAEPFAPPPGILLGEQAPESRLTEQLGAYAESTYTFPSNTRVTVGVRGDYTNIDTTVHDCAAQGPAVTCLDLSSEDGKRVWHNFSYKLRAEQDLTASSLVYVSLASAFLPGDVAVTGGSSGAPVASPYEPETLTSLEIGSKNRYLDNHLQLNGDIFYYRYGGHQVSVQVGSGPGGVPFFATLGSDARMMGAELESLFQLTPADRLGLTLSYTDGWYVDKPALFAAGVANSHLSGIPPWSINPTYCHTFDLLAGQTLTVLSGALFRSGYLITDLTQGDAAAGVEPYFRNGNTVTGNVTVTWNPKSQLSVSAYVRNIADERYKTSIVPNTTNTQTSAATLYDPRTIGVVVSAHL